MYNSKTTRYFLFLLPNLTDFLTVDLNNISIWLHFLFYFFPLNSQELSHFHWRRALYNFSLAYVNCHHHYAGALGPLLSQIRMTLTQPLRDILTVNLIIPMTTEWLRDRQCTQLGYTGQGDDSVPHKWSRTVWDYRLLGMAQTLKCKSCLSQGVGHAMA